MVRAPTAVLLGVLLVVTGRGFDSPSLTVAGLGLMLTVLVCVAWVELARPRRIEREPGPATIVEGQSYPLRLRASGSPLPLPGGELRDPLLGRPFAVGPRWDRRLAVDLPLVGRGRRELAPAELELRDPLGLHARLLRGTHSGEVLVLPRIEPVLAVGHGGAGGGRRSILAGIEEGAASSPLDARAIELEVDGLRPYRVGSPASRIHWPVVARSGELIERRLIAGVDSAPLIVLDASAPDDSEALDAAVRAAGSLCVHLAGRSACAILLPGDRRPAEIDPDLRGWPVVHARLALVDASHGAPPISRAVRSGAVFWVVARSGARLPAALRLGSAPRYLVAPALSAAGAVAFTVAGLDGVRVGARSARFAGRAA